MKKLLAVAVAATVSPAALAEAQTQPEQLLVTASRSDQAIVHNLNSTTVFTREDIERLQVTSIQELLAKSPSVNIISNGGRGAATGLSLRGNQTDHTLFLIDGVRVGSATLGSTAVQFIDPELVERVEIVRGPKSSLYGTDALGGVVNIITRRATSPLSLQAKAGVGSNGIREASASVGSLGSNYSINLTASHYETDGIDNTEATFRTNGDDDGYEQQSLGVTGHFSPTQNLRLGLNYQYNASESEYDTECNGYDAFWNPIPYTCSPYSENLNESLGLSADWNINKLWTTRLNYGQSKNESEDKADDFDLTLIGYGGEFNTEKTTASWLNDIAFNKNFLLTLGYDYLLEEVDATLSYDIEERENHAYFAQLQVLLGDFSANIGARNDDNEQFGDFETYNIAAGYDLNDTYKVTASYAEAFKAPTFNDLYYPNYGNPDFVPEESDTHEIALRANHQMVNWSVTIYQNNIENLIQYDSNTFTTNQVASVETKGLEIALDGEIAQWAFNLAVDFIDSENEKNGKELPRTPNRKLNLDIDRQFGKFSVGTSIYLVDNSYDNVDNTERLDGYGTVDLRAAYAVTPEWKLQLKASNLFDKDHYSAKSYSLGRYQQPGTEVLFSVVYTPSL